MNEMISRFAPITLEEMSSIRLMNRTDTKFVTSVGRLLQLLQAAVGEYRIQEIDGKRNMAYATVYFDTDDYRFYQAHHDGHANRQKVRIRSYVDSDKSYLEVKTKDNHGKTHKSRIPAVSLHSGTADDFLRGQIMVEPQRLGAKMANSFHRITLVNRDKTERLTIDTDLAFVNIATQERVALGNIAIIELKRDGRRPSPILDMLRELRIHPCGFSKYCMGEALTNPSLPKNRMKPRMRQIMKINAASIPS